MVKGTGFAAEDGSPRAALSFRLGDADLPCHIVSVEGKKEAHCVTPVASLASTVAVKVSGNGDSPLLFESGSAMSPTAALLGTMVEAPAKAAAEASNMGAENSGVVSVVVTTVDSGQVALIAPVSGDRESNSAAADTTKSGVLGGESSARVKE